MKKEIFLSFKPDFFRPILYNIKKYEYRKRFCMEATSAYLYLSAPLQEVIGIMELGVPIKTADILDKYPIGSIVYKRIQRCIDSGEQFAIPIESLQLFIKPISLLTLKQLEPSFHVPQCYLELSKYNNIYTYFKKQDMFEIEFYNKHDMIYEGNLGMTCREMELMPEFEEKDTIYNSISKYDIIKCGYLNNKYNKRG